MVVWLIGLSGAGKTTLGRAVVARLKPRLPNLVFLDGDAVRRVFGDDLGHTVDDRRRNAQRLAGLCQYLDDQDVHVVCAVLSIFPEWRRWNREHLRHYFEIFIDAPLDALEGRDYKGLYSAARRGEITNVVGIDIPFPPPEQPDLVLHNDGDEPAFLAQAESVCARLLEIAGREPRV